ncbi:hypothetical protein EVAR_99624_1 [Eumeta japonica]|uniref:Uncharacterized protein n=1 Tax=Eumeta variegata TaxID=151549 RepID=A0A4C2A426_EUMVA|nr:hypothetical protein EVAR_99624_1 [Eumeta japonica]
MIITSEIYFQLEGIIQLAVEASMLPIHAQQNETDAHRSLESISQLLIRIKAMVQVARTDEAELTRLRNDSSPRGSHDDDDDDGCRPPKRRRSV